MDSSRTRDDARQTPQAFGTTRGRGDSGSTLSLERFFDGQEPISPCSKRKIKFPPMSDPFEKDIFYYLKCAVAAIFGSFLVLFFIFLSPIFLITFFQMAWRTISGLGKRSRIAHTS